MGKYNKQASAKELIKKRFSKYKKLDLSLTEDGSAYCKYCDCFINRIKKYNIELHEKSQKHRRNKSHKETEQADMVIESIDSKEFVQSGINAEEKRHEVSRLIGEYLLKGYRMLSTTCDDCNCILLQDLKKRNICVECEFMSSNMTPKVSTIYINEPTETDIDENELETTSSNNEPTEVKYLPVKSVKKKPAVFIKNGQAPILITEARSGTISGVTVSDEVTTAVTSLKNKLQWASKKLDDTKELQECQQAAAAITQIANALIILKSASS